MGDIHEEIRSLTDLVDEVTRVGITLRGTQAQPGLIQQLQKATAAGEAVAEQLETAQALSGQIEKIPENMIAAVDTLDFRTAVARVLSDEVIRSLGQLQDVSLDRLDEEVTRRAMKIAERVINEQVETPLRLAASLARLKRERHTLALRAEKAEKTLADFQALSEKAEQSILDQIEHIRLSSKKPSGFAASFLFAAGWVCAMFASEFWSVITHWIVQQPIPAWFLPYT